MKRLPCPYLSANVELAPNRERHIAERHGDLAAVGLHLLSATLADPDEVSVSRREPGTRLFSRWFDNVLGGKYTVVVVVSESAPARHWVITAYLSVDPGPGELEWQRR